MKNNDEKSCCGNLEIKINQLICENRMAIEILLKKIDKGIFILMNENNQLRENQINLLSEIKSLRQMISFFEMAPIKRNTKKRTLVESFWKWDEIKEVSFEKNKIYKDPEEEDNSDSDESVESSHLSSNIHIGYDDVNEVTLKKLKTNETTEKSDSESDK
jgi:hypothetical protein